MAGSPRWPRWAQPWPLLRPWLPYGAAVVLLVVLHQARLGETLNLLLYDLATQARPCPDGARTPVRIIAIDEADLRRLGWPLADDLLVEAIQRLRRAGVAAIGLDLYRDIGVDPGQARLRALAAEPLPLVTVYSVIDAVGPLPGTPPQRRAYNDLLLDPDGVVRRDLLHVRSQGVAGVALPLRLLEVARGQAISPLRQRLERRPASEAPLGPNSGGYTDLDAAGVQRMLGFHRPGSFPTWSLSQLVRGAIPPAQLRGTIVLIGSRAPSLRDGFTVPFSRPPWAAAPMPGVELHAHRLAALLAWERGEPVGLRAVHGGLNGLVLASAAALGLGLGEGVRSLRRSLVAVAALAVLLLSATLVLLGAGFWLNGTLPTAALLAMAAAAWIRRGGEQQRQRQQLQQLLGQTTSPEVARELWRQRQELLAGGRFRGRQLLVTLVLADIEHFTAVAETLDPEPLLDWLNRGLAAMVLPIQRRGGLVNKFTGDGLLAVFGAPLSQGRHADACAALAAAVAIRTALVELNRDLERGGLPPLRVRIGLHSGWVLAGSLGSVDRWEYGLIGDAVNCVARIEALEKGRRPFPCRVLLSGATRALVGEAVPARWSAWGQVPLAGRAGSEEIWEWLEPVGAGPP